MSDFTFRHQSSVVRCSIIIVNCNGAAWLTKCLESLEQQNYQAGRIETGVGDIAAPTARDEYLAQQPVTPLKQDDALSRVGFSGRDGGQEAGRAPADDN